MARKKVHRDDEWFVRIFSRYGRALRRYLRRFSLNDDTAAELAQEAFLRTYAASTDKEIDHPRAYLFQTAKNLALSNIRRRGLVRTETVEDFDDLGIYEDYPSLESAQISREEFDVLCEAIDQLPPRCQRVFVLRKVYHYSYQEIATQLGIAVSTVEKHVAKGATACHRFLRERGHRERTAAGKAAGVGNLRRHEDG